MTNDRADSGVQAPRKALASPAAIVGCFFGVGMLPLFPGTWASAAAGGMYAAMVAAGAANHASVAGLALFFSALALIAGSGAERAFGRKDPPRFVLDEFAGYFLTVSFLGSYTYLAGFIGFLAFRLFDIIKPFPARRLEQLPRAWGILLDDLAAAVYANLTLRLALLIFGWVFTNRG